MNNAAAFVVGALAAGAGFAATTHLIHSKEAPIATEDAVSPEFDLAAELQSLRDQNADLIERVRALETPLDAPRVEADTSDLEAFKEEVRAFMAKSGSAKTQVQPVLISDVEDALSAIRTEEKLSLIHI